MSEQRHLTPAEVVARVLSGRPAAPSAAELATCKAPGCTRTCDESGAYGGMCKYCAGDRLRDGRWQTMELTDQLTEKGGDDDDGGSDG